MSAEEKLVQAGEKLKEIDAALEHVDKRLAGAEEELAAKVIAVAPSAGVSNRPIPPPAPSAGQVRFN